MRALVVAPAYDTPGRKDASGAFQPEARAFVKVNNLEAKISLFESSRALFDRRGIPQRALQSLHDLDVVAFFCHGWKGGIQAGWSTLQVTQLADLIREAGTPDVTVCLYCCDTAQDSDPRTDDREAGPGGRGGFADLLANRLLETGWRGRLFGHATPGHTTQNPWVRFWAPGKRGEWLVEPHSQHWAEWCRDLRGELRFTYPFAAPMPTALPGAQA